MTVSQLKKEWQVWLSETKMTALSEQYHIIYTHYNTGKAHLIDRDAAGYTEGQKDNSSQLSSFVPVCCACSVSRLSLELLISVLNLTHPIMNEWRPLNGECLLEQPTTDNELKNYFPLALID